MSKLKKSKSAKSEVGLSSKSSNLMKLTEPEFVPPMDELVVKLMSLRLADEPPTRFAVKVTFFSQLLLTGMIKTVGARAVEKDTAVIKGSMSYDPSDYEKMSLFADCPLVVQAQPLKNVPQSGNFNRSSSNLKPVVNISCCTVDILPIFLKEDKICIRKRLEPMVEPRALQLKSWDNLPLVTLEVVVKRNPLNKVHHDVLKKANIMQITNVASYNMIEPFTNEFTYTAVTQMPMHGESNTTVMSFGRGRKVPKKFKATSFYPKWENLRQNEDLFTKGDNKFTYNLEEIQNEHEIDLHYYVNKMPNFYTTVWGSFRRTLMLEKEAWLWNHLRSYKWPFQIHLSGEQRGHSFMAFLNLFRLLYPGVTKVCTAVPLNWINAHTMYEECGCDLLTTFESAPSTPFSQKPAKTAATAASKDSGPPSSSTDNDSMYYRSTGADGNTAFIIVEVALARPLKKPFIPPHISNRKIAEMLADIEASVIKRECVGRGQQEREWLSTLHTAVASLRKVPHYGMTEFCNFYRQLSETRTRVELLTSFTNDASIYVNNSFILHDFIQSEDLYEEMLLMAHACLMRITCQMLVEVNVHEVDPILRAARHARHMQDYVHAERMYLQVVVQYPREANYWREMSTCFMDINRYWGNVCLTQSLVLNIRHPITLLAKGCMVFEHDPEAAEIFFGAILALYPNWNTGWVIVSAFYFEQQMYHMADEIKAVMKKARAEEQRWDDKIGYPRCWDHELGDWWESTPLLPGMSVYYDAADLLLRLRAITLAEVCVARALAEAGESAAYFHLVALCCRLKGGIEDALCHVRRGLEKFGEVNYLRALEAECLHKSGNFDGAKASFDKIGCCVGGYSTLLSLPTKEPQRNRSILVDLIRRHPNAYAWMALADDWMSRAEMGEGGDADTTEEQTSAHVCAAACAVQALKWDRRAGRAWALLSQLVSPSARRLYCREMAQLCGYQFQDYKKEFDTQSEQSLCHRLGSALLDCRCWKCSPSLLKL